MDCHWTLPLTALTLGLRHGVDWDHVAAITDLVAAQSNTENGQIKNLSERLVPALMYALGHAAAIAILGACAMSLRAILPVWIDPFMDWAVGSTLILLGFCVLYSTFRQWTGKEDFQPRSRWNVLWSLLNKRLPNFENDRAARMRQFFPFLHSALFGAIMIGIIHGVSAETGTQSLLIASVGGAESQELGFSMLLSFIVGLLLSNLLIAVLSAAGFISIMSSKLFFLPVNAAAAAFSIIIGILFLSGAGDRLPDLARIFSFC